MSAKRTKFELWVATATDDPRTPEQLWKLLNEALSLGSRQLAAEGRSGGNLGYFLKFLSVETVPNPAPAGDYVTGLEEERP